MLSWFELCAHDSKECPDRGELVSLTADTCDCVDPNESYAIGVTVTFSVEPPEIVVWRPERDCDSHSHGNIDGEVKVVVD